MMRVILQAVAARQVQRERAWLIEHRGRERADAFEEELRHALDLLAECPKIGDPSPRSPRERHWFLLRSRYHVFYRLFEEAEVIRVVRLRHEKQGPLRF
jgi:plasmid stabilization system protein ParE